MNKEEIKIELIKVHYHVLEKVKALGISIITTSINEKWSPAQHIKHLELSLAPVAKLVSDKQKLISKNIGRSKNGSRDYHQIMTFYKTGLSFGVKAPEKFSPGTLYENNLTEIYINYETTVNQLATAIDLYNELELDAYQLIHPLLGLLTIREFVYFYIYHAKHHLANIERDVKEILKC